MISDSLRPKERKMAPPFEFSNQLASWVAQCCQESIVSVELVPHPDRVEERWNYVSPHNADEEERRERESKLHLYSTGFVFCQSSEYVWIMTTVHMMDDLYNAGKPLTEHDIQYMYVSKIMCDHREVRYRSGQDINRLKITALPYRVSCSKDILIYRVPRSNMEVYCSNIHTPLIFADDFPSGMEKVVMVSWPVSRFRTTVMGETSHHPREYGDVEAENDNGYQMSFSEANITSGSGSSGAPLLNGDVEVSGMLHGGDGFLSLFISLVDIRETLSNWGFHGF